MHGRPARSRGGSGASPAIERRGFSTRVADRMRRGLAAALDRPAALVTLALVAGRPGEGPAAAAPGAGDPGAQKGFGFQNSKEALPWPFPDTTRPPMCS